MQRIKIAAIAVSLSFAFGTAHAAPASSLYANFVGTFSVQTVGGGPKNTASGSGGFQFAGNGMSSRGGTDLNLSGFAVGNTSGNGMATLNNMTSEGYAAAGPNGVSSYVGHSFSLSASAGPKGTATIDGSVGGSAGGYYLPKAPKSPVPSGGKG